jgi:hypothetical protein
MHRNGPLVGRSAAGLKADATVALRNVADIARASTDTSGRQTSLSVTTSGRNVWNSAAAMITDRPPV